MRVSNGSASPRRAAVAGMNWAIPCAPLGLTASAMKRLSRHTRRVKKSTGRRFAAASLSMRSQTVSSGGAGAAASAGTPAAEASPSARAMPHGPARHPAISAVPSASRIMPASAILGRSIGTSIAQADGESMPRAALARLGLRADLRVAVDGPPGGA